MRNKYQIRELKRMIEKVERKGNVEFLSRDFESTFGWRDTMSFASMKKNEYLKVVNTEYYDIEVNKVVENVYAVKGNEKIKIADNWREKEIAKKLGFEILVEESNVDIVKGKRYTYKFDIEEMKRDYNASVKAYWRLKRRQAQDKVDKQSAVIERLNRRLEIAEQNYEDAVEKATKKDYTFGLQLM